jgi:lantibiotic modifying enzyme
LRATAAPLHAALDIGGRRLHDDAWLEAARKIHHWLDGRRREEKGLVRYSLAAEDPATTSRDLYHGLPGILLFYEKLTVLTEDPQVAANRDRIRASLLADLNAATSRDAAGLFTGYTGAAWILHLTGEDTFHPAEDRAVQLLRDAAIVAEVSGVRTVSWNSSTDYISGAAGIGLFLLSQSRNPEAFRLAVAAGDGLRAEAIPVDLAEADRGGLKWMMQPDVEREMPNYSHGTAGVCDFLLQLDAACRAWAAWSDYFEHPYDGRFRQAAVAGGRYLASLDDQYGRAGLLPHHFPGGQDLFYLGWCHGPPGTCQLMHALADLQVRGQWREYSAAASGELLRLALHRNRTPGFWENPGLCCGSAGVGSFLVDQAGRFDEPRYLAEARRIGRDILSRGTTGLAEDGRETLCWASAEHRVRPGLIRSQTGLMQGVAGIGLFLLQLEASHREQHQFSIFADLFP